MQFPRAKSESISTRVRSCDGGNYDAFLPSNDRLILAPSSNLSPRFLVTEARSLPARSIMDRVAIRWFSETPAVRGFCNTLICRTAWERDDVAFASVGDIVRLLLPMRIIFMTCCTFFGWCVESPATEIF